MSLECSYCELLNDYSAEVVDSAYEAVEEVVEVVEDASYLSLSETDVYFDADGGSVSIDVDTDGDWDIGTYPYDWGHLTLYNNSITLTVDSYDGDSDREDWFTVKAGVHEVRVDITQWAEVIEVVDSIDYEVIEEVIAE